MPPRTKKTIYNPATDTYVQDTSANRRRIDAIIARVHADIPVVEENADAYFDVGQDFRNRTDDDKVAEEKERFKYICTVTYYRNAVVEGDVEMGEQEEKVEAEGGYVAMNKSYFASKKEIKARTYDAKGNAWAKVCSQMGNKSIYTYNLRFQSKSSLIRVSDVHILPINNNANLMNKILYSDEHKAISTTRNVFNIRTENNELISSYNDLVNNIPDGCWYNLIINAFNPDFDKKYKNKKLNEAHIREVCDVKREGYGMTTNEAILFFKKYNVGLVLFDQMLNEIEGGYEPTKHTNLSRKVVYAIISNQHVYFINDQPSINSLKRKENLDKFDVSSHYYVPKASALNLKYSKDFEGIITQCVSAETNTTIGTDLNLVDVIHYFKNRLGIIPQVSGSKNIQLVSLIKTKKKKTEREDADNIFINIVSLDNLVINTKEKKEMSLELYAKAEVIKAELNSKIFKNELKSYYSEGLKNAFGRMKRPPLCGVFNNRISTSDKKRMGIDIRKCYTGIFNNLQYLPKFSKFDEFQPFAAGSDIKDYGFYIVRRDKLNKDHLLDIIFDMEVSQWPCRVLFVTSEKEGKICPKVKFS